MFELWGWGRDYVELESSIQANMSDDLMVGMGYQCFYSFSVRGVCGY